MDPVVVIGAGPVGQTAALLLARWGLPVVVLDQLPAREPVGSKSICQQRDVLDIWSGLGASAIAEEGLTWKTARTYYQDRELFSWSFAERDGSLLPPFVNISQARTEEILDARIAESPHIEVRWGQEVVDLAQDAGGVDLRCSDGTSLRASYVIACAGAHASVIRASLGVTFEGEAFSDRFLICDIRAELPGWEHERRFYFDPSWNPGRQVLIHPCPGSTYRIDWQVPPDFIETPAGLDRRIQQIIGPRKYDLLWHTVYRFHSRIADRMRVGRVLLAGDCAHLVAPFGARGLNSGVPDAENAAWKIAFVARGWADDSLLETYHQERHAAARENLDVTSATMKFLCPQDDEARRSRRSLLEAASRDPSKAAGLVDSGRFAEPFWYVDSPLTTLDPTRPFAGRPPKGTDPAPGPGILLPDAPVWIEGRRLRDILRDGYTLLLGRDLDPDSVSLASGPPLRVLALDSLPPLAAVLNADPSEAWLIRPDAHIAAILPNPTPATLSACLPRP